MKYKQYKRHLLIRKGSYLTTTLRRSFPGLISKLRSLITKARSSFSYRKQNEMEDPTTQALSNSKVNDMAEEESVREATYGLRGFLEICVAGELSVILRLLHAAQLRLAVTAFKREARHRSRSLSLCLCLCVSDSANKRQTLFACAFSGLRTRVPSPILCIPADVSSWYHKRMKPVSDGITWICHPPHLYIVQLSVGKQNQCCASPRLCLIVVNFVLNLIKGGQILLHPKSTLS